MSFTDESLFISSPFAYTKETISSTRYRWDNRERGEESFVIIQRTVSGYGVFEIEGKTWHVPPEHAFIAVVPEQSVYSYPKEAREPWSFSWVNFYGQLGRSLALEFRKKYGPVLPLPEHSAANDLFNTLVPATQGTPSASSRRLDPFTVSATCYTFLMEWAADLTRPLQQKSDPVRVAISICTQRYREPLGVKELADATGLTREHFTRLFTERTGCSPARYLRHLRLQAAHQMLKTEGVSFQEVAIRSGFPSPRSLRQALMDEGERKL